MAFVRHLTSLQRELIASYSERRWRDNRVIHEVGRQPRMAGIYDGNRLREYDGDGRHTHNTDYFPLHINI